MDAGCASRNFKLMPQMSRIDRLLGVDEDGCGGTLEDLGSIRSIMAKTYCVTCGNPAHRRDGHECKLFLDFIATAKARGTHASSQAAECRAIMWLAAARTTSAEQHEALREMIAKYNADVVRDYKAGQLPVAS